MGQKRNEQPKTLVISSKQYYGIKIEDVLFYDNFAFYILQEGVFRTVLKSKIKSQSYIQNLSQTLFVKNNGFRDFASRFL